jgi:hypothetical protein
VVRESQRRRFANVGLVDKVVEWDGKWKDGAQQQPAGAAHGVPPLHRARRLHLPSALRCQHQQQRATRHGRQRTCATCAAARYEADGLRRDFNALNKQIGELRKVAAPRIAGCCPSVAALSPDKAQAPSACGVRGPWEGLHPRLPQHCGHGAWRRAAPPKPAVAVRLMRVPPPPSASHGQAKQDANELQEKSKVMKERIKECEAAEKEAEENRQAALAPIGNLVHESVPVSNDEVGWSAGGRAPQHSPAAQLRAVGGPAAVPADAGTAPPRQQGMCLGCRDLRAASVVARQPPAGEGLRGGLSGRPAMHRRPTM